LVYTLAATLGWSREYIRYYLPLTEARQLLHCHLMSNPSVWVVDNAGYTAPPVDLQAVLDHVTPLA
jgi:hypothetical protein